MAKPSDMMRAMLREMRTVDSAAASHVPCRLAVGQALAGDSVLSKLAASALEGRQ
jgi:hypothetical protein